MRCDVMQYDATRHDATRHDTTQHNITYYIIPLLYYNTMMLQLPTVFSTVTCCTDL